MGSVLTVGVLMPGGYAGAVWHSIPAPYSRGYAEAWAVSVAAEVGGEVYTSGPVWFVIPPEVRSDG